MNRLTRQIVCLLAAVVLLQAGHFVMAQGARGIEKVRLTTAATALSTVPIAIARAQGYLKEVGQEVTILIARPNVGITALVGGDFHFTNAASGAATSRIQGVPVKVVVITQDLPDYRIYARAELKSPQELKGKRFGTTTIGSLSDTLIRYFLRKYGLDPDRDITLVVPGPEPVKLAAFMTGSLDAAILSYNSVMKLEGRPFTMLYDFVKSKEFFVLKGGLATSIKLIREQPELIQRFVQAYIKGLKFYRARREATIPVMAKLLELDEGASRYLYDATLETMTEGGVKDEAFQRQALEFLKTTLEERGQEKVKLPPSAEVFDLSFARKANAQLQAMGWKP